MNSLVGKASKEVTQVRVINDRYSRVRASKTEIYGLCVFPRERRAKREGNVSCDRRAFSDYTVA
jgi:hypothetical protein